MTLKNKLTNTLTGRDLKTVLHPKTRVSSEVTLSTEKGFHLHSYILDTANLEFTTNNTVMTRLPKKSNVKEIVPELDKIKKEIRGEKLTSKGDDYSKTIWADNFNRLYATKIETPELINVVVRGDIAQLLFLKNKMLVQCTTATCDVLLPSQIDVDLKWFVPKDPVKDDEKSCKWNDVTGTYDCNLNDASGTRNLAAMRF
jgi:hypothetical protein